MPNSTSLSAGSHRNAPIHLRAGCKLNLSLRITGRLPNGYHTIDSFIIPLTEPHDTLEITAGEQRGLTVHCRTAGIDPQNNTLCRAYTKMAQAGALLPSLSVTLHKGIPHGAGLGGGSADAAILLRLLNQLHNRQLKDLLPTDGNLTTGLLTEPELLRIGASIGADIPFFLYNTPAHVSGFGEIVRPERAWRPSGGATHAVLVCPNIHVSTAWAYEAWDAWQKNAGTDSLTTATAQDRKFSVDFELHNSFEPVVFHTHPRLRQIKQNCLEYGAMGALMSGSGSSIFGIFSSQTKAQHAAELLMREPDLRVFVSALNTGASPSW